jgi:hypothetical protein
MRDRRTRPAVVSAVVSMPDTGPVTAGDVERLVADLDAAIGSWQRAHRERVGAPGMRLGAARSWGSAAARAVRWDDAAEGYAAAVVLLPTASLNLRSDLTRLSNEHPDLAGRLDHLRGILDTPGGVGPGLGPIRPLGP